MADWLVVVDDDMANLKAAGYILSRNNIKVSAMKSGPALLDFMKSNRPDLILLDIHMPGMDGFETLQKLREQEGDNCTPVVFLSADEGTDAEIKGIEAGALDFIKKPFVPEVMVHKVGILLEYVKLKRGV